MTINPPDSDEHFTGVTLLSFMHLAMWMWRDQCLNTNRKFQNSCFITIVICYCEMKPLCTLTWIGCLTAKFVIKIHEENTGHSSILPVHSDHKEHLMIIKITMRNASWFDKGLIRAIVDLWNFTMPDCRKHLITSPRFLHQCLSNGPSNSTFL